MNTSPRYEKEDILINFRDMLVHILLRWRSILVGVLVVTLLAGGAKYLLDYRAYKSALDAPDAEETTLSGIAQTNVENALGYHRAYEAAVKYNNESPFMKIDPAAVHTVTLSFEVRGDNSYNAAALYQTALKDAALYETLAKDPDIPYAPALLQELVTSTINYKTDSDTASSAEPVLLQVQVAADNETLCLAIAAGVAQYMTENSEGAASCTLAKQVYALAADATVKTAQTANINAANSLRTNYKNAKDALTAEESAALEQLTAQEDGDDTAQLQKPSVSKKFLVLGFVAGGVLMVAIYGLGYVLDKRVKSREDVQERYGLYLFGTLTDRTAKKSRIDRWIVGLLRKKDTLAADKAAALLTEQVRLAAAPVCKASGTLLITGSALTEEDISRLQPLADALGKDGIELQILASPLQDAAAMAALSDAAGVILAETERVSTYGDIYRELDLCQRLDKAVLGMILL